MRSRKLSSLELSPTYQKAFKEAIEKLRKEDRSNKAAAEIAKHFEKIKGKK